MDDISWFIELYEAHFGRSFPKESLQNLALSRALFRKAFDIAGDPILLYVLTRMWDKDDSDAISPLLKRILHTVRVNFHVFEELWHNQSGLNDIRGFDLLVRAIGEVFIHAMDCDTVSRADAQGLLKDFLGGL